MMFIPLILTGIIIYLAITGIKNNNSLFKKNIEKNEKAIEILNQRFAKGEIDEEEYKRKISVINNDD